MDEFDELQERLDELKKSRAEKDRLQRASQQLAWNRIIRDPNNWEWDVMKSIREEFATKVQLDGVAVSRRIKLPVILDWQKGGFSTFSCPQQEAGLWFGMFYYRTEENILTSDGGGSLVLRTPKLCNDEEWALIVSGNIPEKFKR